MPKTFYRKKMSTILYITLVTRNRTSLYLAFKCDNFVSDMPKQKQIPQKFTLKGIFGYVGVDYILR